jgi:hypothetical protein
MASVGPGWWVCLVVTVHRGASDRQAGSQSARDSVRGSAWRSIDRHITSGDRHAIYRSRYQPWIESQGAV